MRMLTVAIDVDVLLTLIEAARAQLDRDPEPELAAAVQHAEGVVTAVTLAEWQQLRAELRRRGVSYTSNGGGAAGDTTSRRAC
jgi:hypothetical protein